jgi:hypothetical protein
MGRPVCGHVLTSITRIGVMAPSPFSGPVLM